MGSDPGRISPSNFLWVGAGYQIGSDPGGMRCGIQGERCCWPPFYFGEYSH